MTDIQGTLLDRTETRAVSVRSVDPESLAPSQLLWVDLGPDDDEETVRDHLDASNHGDGQGLGGVEDHGTWIEVKLTVPDPRGREIREIRCIVGERWAVTAHDGGPGFDRMVDDFSRGIVEASGASGDLSGMQFLATLTEWAVNAYVEAIQRLNGDLEEFDTNLLSGGGGRNGMKHLLEIKLRLSRLRKGIVSHRRPLAILSHPELGSLGNDDDAVWFGELLDRLEYALQEATDAGNAIGGSFDVLSTFAAERTNNRMAILTTASVALLPGTLIAGLLGMNFRVEFFRTTWLFWIVTGAIIILIVGTLLEIKRRRWLEGELEISPPQQGNVD